MNILETPRLLLRHLEMGDLDDLFALYSQPDMLTYIPDGEATIESAREQIEWYLQGHPRHPELGLWATIYKPTNQFVGRCGLLPWTLDGQFEVEVAYMIDKRFWEQGLGTEAAQAVLDYGFHHLNLSRLVSLIDSENIASIKVAERMGMRFEKEGRDELGPFWLYAISKPFGKSS